MAAALVAVVSCYGPASIPATPVPKATLTWFDRDGTERARVPNSTAAYQDLWMGRDEESVVAALVEGGHAAYYRIDLRSGRRVAVAVDIPAVIRSRVKRLTSWAPDALVFDVAGEGGATEVWAQLAGGDAAVEVAGSAARMSAERRWIAYESAESGPTEIYLRTFPGPDSVRFLVAFDNARRPVWRIDSYEIYHWRADRMLMATSLRRGERMILPTRTTALFTIPYTGDPPPYAVSRDGRRLLIAVPANQ